MAKKVAKASKTAKKPAAPAKKSVQAAKTTKKPLKAAPATSKKAPPLKKPAAPTAKAASSSSKVEKAKPASKVVNLKEEAPKKERPALKVALPVEEKPAEVLRESAPILKKKAEKVSLKTVEIPKGDAPKSVKATLKLLKTDKEEDNAAHWEELHEKFRHEKAQAYDMKGSFEAGRPLMHKVLGWGWVIANENDRLDVLFKDGRRILISNYNSGR